MTSNKRQFILDSIMIFQGKESRRLDELVRMYELSRMVENQEISQSESEQSSETSDEDLKQSIEVDSRHEIRFKLLDQLRNWVIHPEQPPNIGASRTIYLIILKIGIVLVIMFNVFYKNGHQQGFLIGSVISAAIGSIGATVIGCYLISYDCTGGRYEPIQNYQNILTLIRALEQLQKPTAVPHAQNIETNRVMIEERIEERLVIGRNNQQSEEPAYISASKTIFFILFNLGIVLIILFRFLYYNSNEDVWKTLTILIGALTSIAASVIGVYLIGYDCTTLQEDQ